MEQPRKYSQESKQKAVHPTMQAGGSITQVVRDLDSNVAMLGRWCRESQSRGSKAFPGTGMPRRSATRTSPRAQENHRFRESDSCHPCGSDGVSGSPKIWQVLQTQGDRRGKHPVAYLIHSRLTRHTLQQTLETG